MNATRSATIVWFSHLSLILPFFVSGCLVSETTQFTVTINDDGKSGTIVTVMRNVQSDESDPERQERDFEEVLRSWKGDDYLLERMHDGLYVKERKLGLEQDSLVWQETAIFSELTDVFKHDLRNDTLRFAVGEGQSIVATNGTVVRANDSTIVYWALPGARELSLTMKTESFAAKSNFALRFRKYLKENG